MPRVSSSRGSQVGVLLLLYQLFVQIGLPNLPPVTLVAIALQVGLFTGLINFGWTLGSVCLSADSILNHQDFARLWMAPLTHGSDIHLYYNMVSLAWKGIILERRFGSAGFILLLIFFTFSTSFVYVFLAQVASEFLQDRTYIRQCAVGFSGVLFALKVLVNHHDTSNSQESFGFFTVPKKLAVWAELLLIQVMVPQASFLGHLSGILCGLISLNFLSLFHLTALPLNLILSVPGTSIVSGLLCVLHFDLLPKPWNVMQHFWTSRTALVCLSSNYVLNNRDFVRIISGPLEHAGIVHFVICLVSLFKKLFQLERSRRNLFKIFFISSVCLVGTSLTYVALAFLLSAINNDRLYAAECQQGLSGTLFALKVIVLAERSYSIWSPWFLFELAEMFMLLERRTFVYHLSGLLVGSILAYLISRPHFPGAGLVLGYRQSPGFEPWTRSWGYGRRPRPSSSASNSQAQSHLSGNDEASNSDTPPEDVNPSSSVRHSSTRQTSFRSSTRLPSSEPTSASRSDDSEFPPPPAHGGLFYDSQSETSLSPVPNLEEVRRRRLLRFS